MLQLSSTSRIVTFNYSPALAIIYANIHHARQLSSLPLYPSYADSYISTLTASAITREKHPPEDRSHPGCLENSISYHTSGNQTRIDLFGVLYDFPLLKPLCY